MKIKMLFSMLICGCTLFCTAAAMAAEHLLAQVPLKLGAEETVTAELWGDRMSNGYANNLLIMLKNENKKLLAAYTPSISGGYNCLLQPVRLLADSAKGEQLLVSVGIGDWRAASEYRILSFANRKKVREVFGAAESMGIVTKAFVQDGKIELALLDGSESALEPASGSELAEGRIDYGRLHSLTVADVDNDGCDELLGSQQLLQKQRLLADVGAVWKFDKTSREWKRFSTTIMTVSPSVKDNTVNDGKDFDGGAVLQRRMVVPGGEATYPLFACRDVKLQNKVNEVLSQECEAYLQQFYQGKADMPFKVMRADAAVLSVQLISGKTKFSHHHVNINPKTGEKLALSDILDVSNKDLPLLLNVLNTNKNVVYTDKLPDEWYIEGKNLFLMQTVDDTEQVSGFALGNLHKYLLHKQLLQTAAEEL